MNYVLKTLAFAACSLLLSPMLHAQTIATLNCEDEGGFAPITTPLFAFNINTDHTAGVLDATIYVNISFFPLLLSEEGGYYSSCTISGGTTTATLTDASIADVSATGIGSGLQSTNGQIYTSAILTFTSITTGGVTFSAKKPASADAIAKAVAAIKAKGLVIPKGIGEQ